MTLGATARRWLATRLLEHAAGRLRRGRGEWAMAMINEASALEGDGERLRWAAGCALASYRAPGSLDGAAYPAAVLLGIAAVAAYQWTADESLRTVAVVSLIGMALGVLRPGRCLISGVAIGLVVAAVNGFETISGIRPAYELRAHSLAHDARWIVLMAPALIAAMVGGGLGHRFRPDSGAKP